jgi:hypothetical protein
MSTVTLAGIRGLFSDSNPNGSVTGATVQQLLDFLGGSTGELNPSTSGLWQTGSEGFLLNMPGVVSTGQILGATDGAWVSANRLYGGRVVCPRAATLRDITIQVGTQSGYISVAIYDTGDTTAGTYTARWQSNSGSQSLCPAPGWQVIGDPNLTVYAGQQLIFALTCDNTTATFLKNIYTPAAALPTNFMPCIGTNAPKPLILTTSAHPAPSSITEVNAQAGGNYMPIIIARYV